MSTDDDEQCEVRNQMSVERFPVDEGQILVFARAVGDPNPVYSDPAYAATTEVGGIIAPPTFVQSSAHFDPDFPLRPKLGQPWLGSGRTPTGATDGESTSGVGSPRRLHAEQEFQYHRPIRPGDVLSATSRPGERWVKEGRSGSLLFSESVTEYRDQNGELVVTAVSIGVETERPVSRPAD
jgi:acyl dehydratase